MRRWVRGLLIWLLLLPSIVVWGVYGAETAKGDEQQEEEGDSSVRPPPPPKLQPPANSVASKPVTKGGSKPGSKAPSRPPSSSKTASRSTPKPTKLKKVDQKGTPVDSRMQEGVSEAGAAESGEHAAISQGSFEEQQPVSHPRRNSSSTLRIAYCLTGQLARLELVSKIQNIFIANAKAGNLPHVFVWLDRDVGDVKQTYWNYNYSRSVFGGYNRKDIKAFIDDASNKAGVLKAVRTRVKLELPSRYTFAPVHGVIPVKDKAYTGHDGPKDNFEPAASRFQNNMRWMAGLRDCVKWVMDTEQQQGWHYDLVVRLREDTFALGPWILDQSYLHAMTSSLSGSFRGVNDHNFVIARRWADTIFRGLTEDYYFNSSLEHVVWGNPENRIRTLAEVYNVPVRGKNICQQPLLPLRGLVNETYWHLHPLFIRHFFHDCIRLDDKGRVRPGADNADYEEKYEENPLPTCCRQEWMLRVHGRAVPALPEPKSRIYGNNPVVQHDDLYEPPEYRRG